MEATVGQPTPQVRQQSIGQVVAFPTPPDRESLTVRQVADAYCSTYRGRDRSKLPRVEWWASKLGHFRVVDLDPDQIADLLDEYEREPVMRYKGLDQDGRRIFEPHGNRKPSTVNRQKATLSAIITFAKDRRLLPRAWPNPLREVKGRRENNAKTRYLTIAEQDRLLKVARVSSWRRMYLFVLLCLHTGCRKQEALNLTGADVDLERRTALVRRTKTDKQKVLTLTQAIIDEIKRVGVPKSEQLLFPSKRQTKQPRPYEVQKVFAKLVRAAGLVTAEKPEPVGIHTLRHSFASTLAERGVSLVAIADALGHSSAAQVTMRYAHLGIHTRAKLIEEVFGAGR